MALPPIATRYRQAKALLDGTFNKDLAFNTTVYPHWIEASDCFWYRREHRVGHEFRLVDARARTNAELFHHDHLAGLLSAATGERLAADDLALDALQVTLSPFRLHFVLGEQAWVYDGESLSEAPYYPPQWRLSPDGRKAVFARDYNLWLIDLEQGEETPLTVDGDAHYVYGGTATAYGRQEAVTLEARWSPDSRRILAVIKDNRDVAVGPPLVEHVPTDGSTRPRIVNGDRRVGLPGDAEQEGYHLVAIDTVTGALTRADYPRCRVFAPPYVGFFSGHRGWWSADSRTAYFIDLLPGGRTGRLIAFDTVSGNAITRIEETSANRFCFIPDSHLGALLTPLPDTGEVLWCSERSGWLHLYLYDLTSGELKHPVTQGEWLVRDILHVDTDRREVWLRTAGRYSGANKTTGAGQGSDRRHPCYGDICRVHLDTGELTEVVSTDHDYLVCEGKSRAAFVGGGARGVAPSGEYVVTTRSRVDTVPETLLMDRDGKVLMTVETADTSGLPADWQWPTPALLLGADKTTPIDAVIWRPSYFDPDDRYPVIDCSFGIFPPPVAAFTNGMNGNWFYIPPAALAELGFIVVMVGQRGAGIAGGLRAAVYESDKAGWNCLSPHAEDRVAGIRQLAQRHPWMDLSGGVGIGYYVSTHTPLGGILEFPDFYTVAVSDNAYVDHRVVAAFYSDNGPLPAGALEHHPFHDKVNDLKGKLLLIHGMMNPCTPVAATFGFVEALQKANKDFDMLLLPNLGHEDTPYTIRRKWDYFVRHLRREEPPEGFAL